MRFTILGMKRISLRWMALSLCCFALGVTWAVWRGKSRADQLARHLPLRVLCAEHWITAEALEKFSKAANVRIELFTYDNPSEFLRQMANTEGKIDVVCSSSLLLRSLVRTHWLKKMNFNNLPNAKLLSVDFTHLPYDPESEYSVPVFWTLMGFFGKGESPKADTWRQTLHSRRISMWGEELNVLQTMNRMGLKVEERLQDSTQDSKLIDNEMRAFTKSIVHMVKPDLAPIAAEAMMAHADWVLLPLARVARLLGAESPYRFWLPEDGATFELGLFSVGAQSAQPELAMQLINELISTEEALATHQRLQTGVVHGSLSGLNSIAPLQKPQAIRQFALNRLKFPDLNLDVLPRFQKIFDETVALQR